MKRLLRLGVLLLVIAAAGIYFFIGNMDSIARRAIEHAGSDVVGTRVTVGAVNLDLPNGSAVLYDLQVANPPGFSDQALMRFDQLRVDIDVRSLNQDVIRIHRIGTTNPVVLYEINNGRINLDVVREHLASRQPVDAAPPEPGSELVLAIGEIEIEGIQGSLLSAQLPRQVNVNLGDVRLEDMQGTAQQIALQIARPLFEQISRHAATALVRATTELLEAELTERAEEAIRDRIGDLFRR